LDLNALRAVAQQGKIYSLIYENYEPGTLLEISKNPKVKALYVADVRLRCASASAPLCEPVRT
jgi:hypothetical protein